MRRALHLNQRANQSVKMHARVPSDMERQHNSERISKRCPTDSDSLIPEIITTDAPWEPAMPRPCSKHFTHSNSLTCRPTQRHHTHFMDEKVKAQGVGSTFS